MTRQEHGGGLDCSEVFPKVVWRVLRDCQLCCSRVEAIDKVCCPNKSTLVPAHTQTLAAQFGGRGVQLVVFSSSDEAVGVS